MMRVSIVLFNFWIWQALAQGPNFRTVCYFEGWSHYRPDPVQFEPEDVQTSLCTHLIFAFASLDPSGLHVIAEDSSHDPQMYVRLTNLKREKPDLKVMLAVGGWNIGSEEFTKMVSTDSNIQAFAANVIEYLHRYNFDGLDVDWEYPADRGSPMGDKHRFTKLLEVLDQEFLLDHQLTDRSNLLLSAAISPAPYRIGRSYEIPDIATHVDFLNVMTYDFHGPWDSTVGHHSSLYSPSEDETDSIDYMLTWMLNASVPRDKMNLGLAFYGRSLNLTDTSNFQVGASISGSGAGGELLKEEGVLAYYEVCKLLTEHGERINASGRLPGTQSPYVVDGTRWTGYDDVHSITEKVDYAVSQGLGGVFIWAIGMDDFHGLCGAGHNPLLTAIQNQLHPIIGR